MNMDKALKELRRDPASWLGFDEETRHLLKQQAAEKTEVLTKGFDPLTGERTSN